MNNYEDVIGLLLDSLQHIEGIEKISDGEIKLKAQNSIEYTYRALYRLQDQYFIDIHPDTLVEIPEEAKLSVESTTPVKIMGAELTYKVFGRRGVLKTVMMLNPADLEKTDKDSILEIGYKVHDIYEYSVEEIIKKKFGADIFSAETGVKAVIGKDIIILIGTQLFYGYLDDAKRDMSIRSKENTGLFNFLPPEDEMFNDDDEPDEPGWIKI